MIYIFAGLILGLISFFSAGGIFVLILFLICICLIKNLIKTESKEFLLKLFIISFILRVIFSFANYYVGLISPYKGADTQPDAINYNNNALYIADVLKGSSYSKQVIEVTNDPTLADSIRRAYEIYNGKMPIINQYQYSLYVFLLGMIYAWLGYCPIAVKVMNGLLGCLSIIIVYYIARKLFEEESTARLSAILFAFFPSIIYWSVTALRDTLINFLFLLYLLCNVIFIKENKKIALLISFLLVYLINIFRPSLILLIIMPILSIFKNICKSPIRLSITFIVILLFISMYKPKISNLLEYKLNEIKNYHIDALAESSSTAYKIYPNFLYNKKYILKIKNITTNYFIFSIIKAWLYYLFSPFPWSKWTSYFLPFYPQVIFTYFLFPLAVIGMLLLFRKNLSNAFIIFSSCVFIITIFALAEGIMGIVFRHRDIFTPFGLILVAYGIRHIFYRKIKII